VRQRRLAGAALLRVLEQLWLLLLRPPRVQLDSRAV
jgi:hypothetical protein